MRKFVALAMVLVMAIILVGCSSSQINSFTSAQNSSLTYREIGAFIESQLVSKFDYTEVSYDETGTTIFLSLDGISTTCLLAQIGSGESDKPWEDILSSTLDLSKTITESFQSAGYNDYVVSVVIVNDTNSDDILAMFLNEELVYNAANAS